MKLPLEAFTSISCSDHSGGEVPLTNRPDARILIVDDELAQRKVLAAMFEQGSIACGVASSAQEALDLLQVEPVDAVVADLNMPGTSGMDLLREIRLRYPQLVFVMATGIEDVQLGVQAMRQGADDYLTKPLQLDSVLASLDRAFQKKSMEQEIERYRRGLEQMVCERTVQLQRALQKVEQSYAETLEALGAAIDLRDGQTAGHSRRVALYSIKILTLLNGTSSQLRTLVMGAWLHDIGKLAIPDKILLKPGSLSGEERRIMQNHVQIGYDLVKRIPFLNDAAEIILTHHEHWDGRGYPRGLKGTDIPYSARIFSVADTLDAMTSNRPYRSALSLQKALTKIKAVAGTQHDAEIVDALMTIPVEVLDAIREQSESMQISEALAGTSAAD